MIEARQPSSPGLVVIEPGGWKVVLHLGELWEYRELVYFLAWRDVRVRYKQTVLGVTWAILQPLLAAAVFAVIFGRLAGFSSEGVPYVPFAYCGLLPWFFFAQAVTQSSASLVGSANLVTKVYFPRLVIPLAAVLSALFDLLIACPVLFLFMWHYGIGLNASVLVLPIFLGLAFLAATGIGVWLSALTVEYRDIRHAVPFSIQIWFFLTPVIYPASHVTPFLQRLGIPDWVLGINPMTGVVEGFRWAFLGMRTTSAASLAVSAGVALLVLATGVLQFRRAERSFADII